MKPPFPSLVPTWHNDTYPAISPSRPELSVAGKTVVITGAGSGIGRETAIAFAQAGAKQLHLIGRSESTLNETKKLLPGNAICSVHPASIADEGAIRAVAAAVGTWHVLVLSAAILMHPVTVAQASLEEWWKCFEVNAKGTMVTVQAFLRTAPTSGASIIGISSGSVTAPAQAEAGQSAYSASKIASVKVLEHVAMEHPHIFVANVHPGVVKTGMYETAQAEARGLPVDTVQLPAHFLVWLVSAEASFLNGRFVDANWDVDELKGMAEEIRSGGQRLTSGILGWPFPHVG